MSYSLPPEILDLIVDHLCDELITLKACCVVSKSWAPRARKHLFARIQFHQRDRPIESWMQAFPHPSSSLAHHVRTLSFSAKCTSILARPDVRCWIRTFQHVENLDMEILGYNYLYHGVSLVQLHGFSPTLKSLILGYTSVSFQEVFNLICSFPLLEDLGLISYAPTQPHTSEWNPPPTSPKLTGTLEIRDKLRSVARRLCDLPGGLHFSKIRLSCWEEEPTSAMDLVSRCSDTLESLAVTCYSTNMSEAPSLDLSKAVKLKDVAFRCGWLTQWVTTIVKTAKSENLQQITIVSFAATVTQIEETVYQQWQDLDHLLVQLWTSRSIRPRVVYKRTGGGDGMRDAASRLLPELTRRGFVDMIEPDELKW